MSSTPRKHAIHMPTPEEDAEIMAAALSDPDALPLTDEQLASMTPLRAFRRRTKTNTTKQALTLRYDADIIAAFRASGPGWQSRMNAALREWLQTHTPHP